MKILITFRIIYAVIYFGIIFNYSSAIIAQSTKLNNQQIDDVKELLIVIDVIDGHLREAWNTENDYGVATEKDKIFFNNVQNVSRQISKRISKLPKGDYRNYIVLSIAGYLDVSKMRLLSGIEGGEDKQIEIATKYKLQDSESNLWAYTIWQIARRFRNKVATELMLPTINYEEN